MATATAAVVTNVITPVSSRKIWTRRVMDSVMPSVANVSITPTTVAAVIAVVNVVGVVSGPVAQAVALVVAVARRECAGIMDMSIIWIRPVVAAHAIRMVTVPAVAFIAPVNLRQMTLII